MNNPIPHRIADLLRQRMQPGQSRPDLGAAMLEEVMIGALLDDATATHMAELRWRSIDGVDAFRTCGMEQHGRGCVVTLDDGTRYAVTIRRMQD